MTNIKSKLFFTSVITIFSIATFILTLFNYNPFSANQSVFVAFYLSLIFSLTGIISLILIFIRSRFSEKIFAEVFWPSVRFSFLAGLVISILLMLQGFKVLNVWVGAPIALAILLIELFFRGNKFRNLHKL